MMGYNCCHHLKLHLKVKTKDIDGHIIWIQVRARGGFQIGEKILPKLQQKCRKCAQAKRRKILQSRTILEMAQLRVQAQAKILMNMYYFP